MTAVVYLCFMIYFNATLTVAAIGFMGFNFFSIRYISPRIRQVNKEAFVKRSRTGKPPDQIHSRRGNA